MSNPAVMLVRRLLHLIAHATGWNRCQPIRGGYICVGCGETVTWDLPPGDPATYCAGIITSITRDEMTVTVQSEPDNYITYWLDERQEAIDRLREICATHGDNDWGDDLHIADIIDKHLIRHIDAQPATDTLCICKQLKAGCEYEQEWPPPHNFYFNGVISKTDGAVEVHDSRCPVR